MMILLFALSLGSSALPSWGQEVVEGGIEGHRDFHQSLIVGPLRQSTSGPSKKEQWRLHHGPYIRRQCSELEEASEDSSFDRRSNVGETMILFVRIGSKGLVVGNAEWLTALPRSLFSAQHAVELDIGDYSLALNLLPDISQPVHLHDPTAVRVVASLNTKLLRLEICEYFEAETTSPRSDGVDKDR